MPTLQAASYSESGAGYRGATPVLSPRDSRKCLLKWTLPSGGGGEPPAVWPAGRSAFIGKQEGVPGGHSLFSFSLAV